MPEVPELKVEPVEPKASTNPGEATKFNSESARIAGILSGMTRKKFDPEDSVRRAKLYCVVAMDLLAQSLFSPGKCPHCKRQGPSDFRSLDAIIKRLAELASIVCERIEGKAPTASRSDSKNTVEAFKRLTREVHKANASELSEEAQQLLDAEPSEDGVVSELE